MIWPFRPHAPLPLAHKVASERRFEAVARLLGRHRLAATTVFTPQDVESLAAGCEFDELPERVFGFCAQKLLPAGFTVRADWATLGAVTDGNQSSHYLLDLDDSGRPKALHFHPCLSDGQALARFAAVAVAAAADCLLRMENQAESLPAESLPAGSLQIVGLMYGFGPIVSSSLLHDIEYTDLGVAEWDMSRVGQVSALEFGYCMALADWALQSDYGDVAATLRSDAGEGLTKGLRFLSKTSDCCFTQEFLDTTPDDSSQHLVLRLNHSSPSVQLGTLFDLTQMDSFDDELLSPLAELLRHREPDIQQLAATNLSRCDNLSQNVHDELLILAENGPVGLRRAAIAGLRPGFDNDTSVVEVIAGTLKRADVRTGTVCIQSLLKYDAYPHGLTESLVRCMSAMVSSSKVDDQMMLAGLSLLGRLQDDPLAAVQKYFADDPTAIAIFEELIHSTTADA